MPNVEMFKRVRDVILADPEKHDQKEWEDRYAACGTTRCVAGWALWLWGQDNDFHPEATLSVLEDAYYANHKREVEHGDIEEIGEHLLGLNDRAAYALFHNGSNADALRMVSEYADGETNVTPSYTG